jgi:tRNA uridine 5-carboxymethylaminomethyl modification enzyme
MGLVDDARWDAFSRKRDAVSRETERLRSLWISPKNLAAAESERVLGKAIEHEYSLAELLRRPDVSYADLMSLDSGRFANAELPIGNVSRETAEFSFIDAVVEQIDISAKYSGYIDRQKDEIDRAAHYENLKIPAELDYLQVTALSFEVRQRLSKLRPETLGQASRVSGVTPAAISLLLVHLKKHGWKDRPATAQIAA